MNPVSYPISHSMRGARVSDLHAVLDELAARKAILGGNAKLRKRLLDALAKERADVRYGSATRDLVAAVQGELGLAATGEVDEATARALNRLNDEPAGERPVEPARPQLSEGMAGAEVMVVQEALKGAGLRIAAWELTGRHFGETTRAALLAWQERSGLPADPVVDAATFDRLVEAGRELPRSVRGTVTLPGGAPGTGLVVVALDRGFRRERVLGQASVDGEGHYRIGYSAASMARAGRGAADIALRVLAPDGTTVVHETAPEDVLVGAPADAVLPLEVAYTAPVVSEFERVARAIKPLIGEVPVDEIGSQDAGEPALLARQSGIEPAVLTRYIMAHRLAKAGKVDAAWFFALLCEDGLYGIGASRPRAQLLPVTLGSDVESVLYEAVLLEPKVAAAAVQRAVRKHRVPPQTRAAGTQAHERLRELKDKAEEHRRSALAVRGMRVLERLVDQDGEALAALLAAPSLDDADAIIAAIDTRKLFAPQRRGEVQALLQLAVILGFDAELVEQVSEETTRGERPFESADLRRLARLRPRDWAARIARAGSVGERPDSPIVARQARSVAARLEASFPTAAAASRLERGRGSALPRFKEVAAFLGEHPELELRDHKLVPFLKQAGVDPASIEPNLRRSVEKLQRTIRLGGTLDKAETLLAAGFGSSAEIAAAGKSQFMAAVRAQGGMPQAEAARVFETAQNNNVAAIQLAGNLRTMSNAPAIFGGTGSQTLALQIQQVLADQPDLASLFGSHDACECQHCRSIYGPAAYFADIMRFLRDRLVKTAAAPALPGTRAAKDVLFARRPDLGEINLDCDNALIEVPHIDIVCELAEEAVAPDPGFSFNGAVASGVAPAALLAAVRAHYPIGDKAVVYGPYAPGRFILRDASIVLAVDGPGPNWTLRRLRQTHGTVEERAAAPEYVNVAAYQLLRGAKAAFGLPFDLFHAETRAYLAAAGIDRADLMEALAAGGTPSARTIAVERLGLTAAEAQLIFAADLAGQPAIWGASGATAAPELKTLDVFTRKTDLDYRGVDALIAGTYVRGTSNLFIRDLDNSCDLSAKEIANLDDSALDRIHRVLRLARKTGIGVAAIDRLAMATKLGAGDLGEPALLALADLAAAARALESTPERLIAWLDAIPVAGTKSQHVALFENPTLTGPLSIDLSRKALAGFDASPGSAPTLQSIATDLATVFGARLADIDAMIARLAALAGAAPKVSSANLAALFGRIELARVLGLPVRQLLALERLAAADPMASAAKLRSFVRTAQAVIATGVPVDELSYRLARDVADPALLDLAEGAIAAAIAELRGKLLTVRAENASPYDADLDPSEQIESLKALLGRQPQLSEAAIAVLARIAAAEPPAAADAAVAKAVVDAPADAASDGGLAGVVDGAAVKAAIDAVVASPGTAERKAYVQVLMGGIAQWAVVTLSRQRAIETLAALLSTPVDRAATILDGAVLTTPGGPVVLAKLFAEGDIADPTVALTVVGAPQLFRGARLGHAIAGILAPFDPPAATVAFLLAQAAALGWMELSKVPFETGSAAVALADWLEWADALALLRGFPPVVVPSQPGTTAGAIDVFAFAAGGGAKPQLLATLAIVTGWPAALLSDADTRLGLTVADYLLPATWRALKRVIGLLNILRVPLAEAVSYTQATLGDAERTAARRMLAARYLPGDWLGALKTIIDPIREAKRDALVAYLLANNPQLQSTADLYDHFLTDVLWSAKMPSSRLVHAHGTLQLFIERCIAGLEPNAVADLDNDQAWAWWEWMKNYRVWEVGRKVFVEAQYYLKPPYRDDKTEPFAAMESALMQNEATQENIQAAFEGYLDELDRIAFLDVLATCYDFDSETLHVFGCTKGGEPHGYFHRTLQRERVWTPWRRIDLDIAGEHLIAFFRNKRLCLAWATFTEKGDEQQDTTFPEPGGSGPQPLPPTYRWSEVKLSVSENTGKRWLPRRQSEDFIATPSKPEPVDLKKIFLTVTPGTKFTVDVCSNADGYAKRLGSFLLTGCKGYPEVMAANQGSMWVLPQFEDTAQRGQRLVEQDLVGGDRLAMSGFFSGFQALFDSTPGTFRISYPYQASEIDQLISMLLNLLFKNVSRDRPFRVFGSLMPFFFEDNVHGYVLIPGFYGKLDPETGTRQTVKTFSNVRRLLLDIVALFVMYLTKYNQAGSPAAKQAVLDELAADPELARIKAEVASYQGTELGILVRNFYHPLSCFLREKFFEGGIPALLARSTQLHVGAFQFDAPNPGYQPTGAIVPPYPKVELEFGRESAYAAYNWELTFHAPHLIATMLMEAGQHDDAERWLRYIFDPLGSSTEPKPQRYWKTKHFFLRDASEYAGELVSALMNRLANDPAGAVETELADAVWDWRSNPFKPYLVARSRTTAFQRAIVDLTARNYIGRADAHFRRDQLEDLVIASLDYSRAERLIGRRPAIVPSRVAPPPETYNQLAAKLDLFGNALLTIENLLPDLSVLPQGGAELPPPPLSLESLYFCIPPSEKLYELWDLLEERQFNLRNSRTIDGVERSLSLFAPPLSVEELIKASAAGLSISEILSSLSAPRPPYHFEVMLDHAHQLADRAASYSARLESALAARDTEGLVRLKAEQEGQLLDERTATLVHEIKVAGGNIASAKKTLQVHTETRDFYAARPYMNPWEIAATVASGVSLGLQAVVAIGYAASGALSLVPSFMIGAAGFGGSPTANAQTGGQDYSSSARDFVVGAIGALASTFDKAAGMLDKQGTYLVRQEDWAHAAKSAGREAERANIEIAIAQIRETIAKEALRVHKVQQEQAAAELAYHKAKFTNRELFDWLSGELRVLSRQMYDLASKAAKAAERCYNFELGRSDSFIRSGQWNNARRGLLAADKLSVDLDSMKSAYLARNVRQGEMVKEVSLARLDPVALLELRTTGRCTFQLPEALFDLEHPGQYFRRIKMLSVTAPCVAGPYSSVPIKLTQINNRVRISTAKVAGATTDAERYAEDPGNDPRFRYNVGAIETIETSHGDDDSGVHSPDADDERYMPFEGSGLCSAFVAELPPLLETFDRSAIADLVLKIRYTALNGGGAFRTMVSNGLIARLNAMVLKAGRVGLFESIDLRRAKPDVWFRLVTTGTATFTLTKEDLPYFAGRRAVGLANARVLARIAGAPASQVITVNAPVNLTPPAEAELAGLLSSSVAGLTFGSPITITVPQPGQLEEMAFILNYTIA